MLQVTSNVDLALVDKGLGFLHEPFKQQQMFESVTRWTAMPRSHQEISQTMLDAFNRFQTERPGPIEIEVPTDILHSEAEVEVLGRREQAKSAGNTAAIAQAAEALSRGQAHRHLGGRRRDLGGGDGGKLRALAERLGAVVVTTYGGQGRIPRADHPQYAGVTWGGRGPYGPKPHPPISPHSRRGSSSWAAGCRTT